MDYAILPTKKGFSVHVAGCTGLGRKARQAHKIDAAGLQEAVEDARERGHVVTYCACTGPSRLAGDSAVGVSGTEDRPQET